MRSTESIAAVVIRYSSNARVICLRESSTHSYGIVPQPPRVRIPDDVRAVRTSLGISKAGTLCKASQTELFGSLTRLRARSEGDRIDWIEVTSAHRESRPYMGDLPPCNRLQSASSRASNFDARENAKRRRLHGR